MPPLRQTRFSDVCGTIDELKRMLHEEPDAGLKTDTLVSFVEDCLYMIDRMERRLNEFQEFGQRAARLVERIDLIPDSRRDQAREVAGKMLRRFREQKPFADDEVTTLCVQAEQVRDVAGELEQLLRRFKEAAMELGALYRKVEGGRGWDRDSRDAEQAGLEAQLAAWLPPSPHREKILDFLRRDRAILLPTAGDEVPLVQFEDGGVIALTSVRWSDAVSNFVPASFDPSPNALRYREEDE